MIDFIQGNKFEKIADWAYAPNEKHTDDYYGLVNTFDLAKLKDGDIIFTYPFYVAQLFEVIKDIDKRFVIVTHNGDNRVDSWGITYLDGLGKLIKADYFKLPDNVIKWYATNINTSNPRIEAIPSGLENDMWHPEANKKERMLEMLKKERVFKNLVYLDFTIMFNPYERSWIYFLLEDKPWATSLKGKGMDFERYVDNVYNHKFAICPSGNGVGTHRPWEALYLGTIPIKKKNFNNKFYTDLPICFVDEWDQITEEFLNSEYDRIKSKTWKMEMLTFEYWKNKIQNTR
jgi:hypothetical protein